LPQTEIGTDPGGIRTFAETIEEVGFDHLLVYDHVLGADAETHTHLTGPYRAEHMFHEIMVLLGYLAAATSRLELAPGVVIAPQRQTALLAKQAAEIDVLSGGRLRLGLGIGWNDVEFEALGTDFSNRGRRFEEQIELMRRLWTEPSLSFEGEFDRVTGAGLAPLPVQRPIPVWIGAQSPRAYERAGRLADGWFPQVRPGEELDAAKAIVDEAATRAGRDPASLGMEGRVTWRLDDLDKFVQHVDSWRRAGATHVSINTMRLELGGVDGHLAALERAADALDLRR
jgi:probable F420-dependent oxidoreductase